MRIFACPSLLAAAACIALTAAACSTDRNTSGQSGVIMPADVSLPGLQMRPDGDRSAFILAGRIRNRNSRSTITEVTLHVWMEDVLESGSSITSAATTVVLRQEVPPGASGSFEEKVLFKDLPTPRGRHEWNYAVTGLKGK